jgi:hypothetical protein
MKKILGLVVAMAVVLGSVSAVQAGRRPVPGKDIKTVSGYSTVTYTEEFYGGQLAVVRVIGDGDSDLDLYVYDEFGNLIDKDTRPGDNCVVTFKPRWTGKFTIKVVNCGRMSNCYTLTTN